MVEIPMPLTLDKNYIGFTAGSDEVEVVAMMDDIQYLGVLDADEYASFFPVWLDLSKAEYLTGDQRDYIGQMDEATRSSYRASAMSKLQLKEQFVWSAEYEDTDYSDSLSFEPLKWSVYEATETEPPRSPAR